MEILQTDVLASYNMTLNKILTCITWFNLVISADGLGGAMF